VNIIADLLPVEDEDERDEPVERPRQPATDDWISVYITADGIL